MMRKPETAELQNWGRERVRVGISESDTGQRVLRTHPEGGSTFKRNYRERADIAEIKGGNAMKGAIMGTGEDTKPV